MRSLLALVALSLLALPSPAEEPRFEIVDNALKLPGPIVFDTGSDTLRPESDPALSHAKAYLTAKPDITLLRVEAHAGGASAQALSEKRAAAVARWLVGHGVDCRRLVPVGFGDTKPVAAASTPEGRAANERVVLVNAALRGRRIGGLPVDGGGMVAADPCR